MINSGNLLGWSPCVKIYDPLKAGSIDGTDLVPHDNAVVRAMCAEYVPPGEQTISSNPKLTLFVGRLNIRTSERQLAEEFSKYGNVKSCCVVQDIATGMSRGYGFVEFKREGDAQKAWKLAHGSNFHDRQIIVEWEFARTMPGWIPRRLGGGLGGKKESGQLRFGGRDRPFRKPFIIPQGGEPSNSSSVTESSKQPFTNIGSNRDGLERKEKYQNEPKLKSSKYEHDGRSASSRNYNDEDRRKYKSQTQERPEYDCPGRDRLEMRDDSYREQYLLGKNYSGEERRKYRRQDHEKPEYSYQVRDSSKKRDDSYSEQYSQASGYSSKKRDDSYSEQYSQASGYDHRGNELRYSKRYESYESSNCEERHPHSRRDQRWSEKMKSSNYVKEHSHIRNDDYWDHKSQDLNIYKGPDHYLEDEHYSKINQYHFKKIKHREKICDENPSDPRDDPSIFDIKSHKDSYKNHYESRISHKDTLQQSHKRDHSSDTSSSYESTSRSKHKKSKHKKKKHKSDLHESKCSLSKSNKKHKKKKKSKHKRTSSGESD